MHSTQSKTKQKHKWQFDAIGTRWSIETERELDLLQQQIIERIHVFDRTYSRFRADSLVYQMTTTPGRYVFPADAQILIDTYRKLYDATDGVVSPLVGGILDAAGYDAKYSLIPKTVTPAPSWDSAMDWQGRVVESYQPLVLDFGAAGKGYLVDIIAELLEKNGVDTYVIDASGDLRIKGGNETIGLENPHDSSRVIGVVNMKDGSLCASATTRRAWGEWHHIVDPFTTKPVSNIVATWVIASTTILADALATALFFVPADRLSHWNFQYVLLYTNGTVEKSQNFVGELYL
jgi:FAD:protein FMN transferase